VAVGAARYVIWRMEASRAAGDPAGVA